MTSRRNSSKRNRIPKHTTKHSFKRTPKHTKHTTPTRTPAPNPHPHDAFFRYVFSKPRHAHGLLHHLLPASLSHRLLWPTLRLEPGSFIDPRLAATASDVLLSIRLRGSPTPVLLYLLFDHQSTVDSLMPLRMLGYAHRAWCEYLERHDAIAGHIPVLVPLLFYQGERPWTAARRLSDLHQLPGAPPHDLPIFIELDMILHELRVDVLPPHGLTMLVRAALSVMKLVAAADFTNVAALAQWIRQVRHADGEDDSSALLHYIFHTHPNKRIIDTIAEELPPDMRNHVMSIAEELMADGRELGQRDGQREGQRQGQATLIQRLLTQRFGTLPPRVVQRVQAGTLPELERWSMRLLAAATLDDVFADDE